MKLEERDKLNRYTSSHRASSLDTDATGSLSDQVRKLMTEVQEMKKQKSS